MNEHNDSYIHPKVLRALRITGAALVLLTIFLVGKMAFTFCLGLFAEGDYVVRFPGQGSPVVAVSTQDESQKISPHELAEIARVEVAVAGDLMLQMPIVRNNNTPDGYIFDPVFYYIKPYISGATYAIANLETTLSGTDGITYTDAPAANSPDSIAEAARIMGFDMLLTGNEHGLDYGLEGLQRTLRVLRENELDTLGTVENPTDPRHKIRTVGGINIGMASYTFAQIGGDGGIILNGASADADAAVHVNTFDYDYLSRFYTEVEGELSAMRAGGADVTVVFLHWGDAYSLHPSENQKAIAQKLCDLGVDVIIGSHPNVVQPMELLRSSLNPDQTTICLYSVGNFLTNPKAKPAGMGTDHCEDGLIFRFTLAKLNDGSARVSAVSLMPTWTLVRGTGERQDFFVIPLDSSVVDWKEAYSLSDEELSGAKNSYNRTMAQVTSGMNQITTYLSDRNSLLDPTLGVG